MSILKTLRRALTHEIRTVRGAVYRRLHNSRERERSVVRDFHQLYFDARAFDMTWRRTYWLGYPILKCPLDLWLYQEIMYEARPDLVIETGTAYGGSALYLASMCELIGKGRVLSIDLEAKPDLPQHARIDYLTGSSVADDVLAEVRRKATGAERVMVILDSDHAMPHVRAELEAYSPLVTAGSYLIVEDTNLNGNPVALDHGPGPMEAVSQFLSGRPEFVSDESKEKFLLTFNPKGYLRRLAVVPVAWIVPASGPAEVLGALWAALY